ncbi:hypothetical protein FACS1894202_03730 [Clostridia bacterium]|nr:hypothetical protein FACS1894202_03730 [Clostridia bacterium]
MFRNLRAELARAGLSQIKLAGLIGMSKRAMTDKMNGTTEFKRSEMIAVRDAIAKTSKSSRKLPIEDLFDQSQ